MGILEPITHKEEIDNLLADAQNLYDTAKKNFELQKARTTEALKELGKVKIGAWSNGMDKYVSTFGAFNNIEMREVEEDNYSFVGMDEEPKQLLMNMENASLSATEVAQAGFAAVGTGALVGVAAYGGAMMFGTASTGTAIATLSGIAKTNATLAWFGGGAKAVGGLGMAAGKLVLAGIVVAPILGVAAVIAGVKGKEKLAEAKKIHAEAEEAAEQLNTITSGMGGIARMSDNYRIFIKRFDRLFQPFIKEIERIKNSHESDDEGRVDFDSLSKTERKTLHISWLMAQIYYNILATPILTKKGEVSDEAQEVLNASKKNLRQIRRDTFSLTGEEAKVGDIVWKPLADTMFAINGIIVILYLVLGIFIIRNSIVKGLLFIGCSLVAFPLFIRFNNLPASREYIWRLVRLIIAIVLGVAIALFV